MERDMEQTLRAGGTGMDLNQQLTGGAFDVRQIGDHLDGLDGPARLAAVRGLSGRAQAHLYEAARGVKVRRLEDLVPTSTPPLTEIVHDGINSLPMFRTFAKVFCRPDTNVRELWGYNRCGRFVETVVGPGSYVAYETPEGEVMVDYTRLPTGKPAHWPNILSNEARLSRFVYASLQDALRGVSTHVTIGRAIRGGQVADNWFVLCRR